MVFKQVLLNVMEYALIKFQVSRKISKVDQMFKARLTELQGRAYASPEQRAIEEEDLKMHKEIEK